MNSDNPHASIILLTYNGEVYLEEVLESVFKQKTNFTFEVIAIDSGSSDRTIKILAKQPIRLYQIPNYEFGHGKTRNLGARLATGKYLVFLTQDATPANSFWLQNLVRPMEKDVCLAGVYSRQIPRSDCNPCEWRDIEAGARPVSILKQVNLKEDWQRTMYRKNLREFIVFSNVSSCLRKDVLAQLTFSEQILMVEDQDWAKRAIEAGWCLRYESTSVVYHSHNHSLSQIFKRQRDYGSSYIKFAPFNISLVSVAFYSLCQGLLDAVFILKQRRALFWKLTWITKAPVVRFMMRYGLYKGLQAAGETR
jgi:glycosyltransferase involved in cell wall biosynthesis